MLSKIKIIALLIMIGGALFAQDRSALEIIRILDSYEPKTQTAVMHMIIKNNGRTYTNEITEWREGHGKTLYEFTGLEQSGDKFMQLGKKAWLYSADMEEVLPMSKHMLRESAFGSDVTFEELAEGITIEKRYKGTLLDSDPEYPNTYVLELNAKKKTESVQKKIIYVDIEGLYTVKIMDFAPSGALLKETEIIERTNIDGHILPIKLITKDSFKKGSSTTITWENLIINEPIDKSIFSMSRFGE